MTCCVVLIFSESKHTRRRILLPRVSLSECFTSYLVPGVVWELILIPGSLYERTCVRSFSYSKGHWHTATKYVLVPGTYVRHRSMYIHARLFYPMQCASTILILPAGACYDRGTCSTFLLKRFLNDRAPQPQMGLFQSCVAMCFDAYFKPWND